jgi:hypothetical protein
VTLLDRIQNLQLRAVAADDENKIKTRVGEFTTLRVQLESATSNAARVAVGRGELRAAGIRQDDPAQGRAPVLAIVEDFITAARTLPVDVKIDAARLSTRTVVDFFGKSQKWVEDNWQITLQSGHPEVDDDLLDALEHGGIDVDAIRHDIDQAESVLFSLRYRSIPEAGDHAKLLRAREVLNSLGERIAELIDPRIAGIIVRAQAEGVPFAEFTNEVVAGLRQLGILERFRIRLK